MYDVGDFIEFANVEQSITIILPTAGIRPQLPYVSMVFILSQQQDIYQRGRVPVSDSAGDFNQEDIYLPRHTQFSLTAIGNVDTRDAEDMAQNLFNFLNTQTALDFFRNRREAVKIAGAPSARFLIQDNFNEARIGFDIEIRDVVKISDTDKDFIDTVSITDTSSKVSDILIEDGS